MEPRTTEVSTSCHPLSLHDARPISPRRSFAVRAEGERAVLSLRDHGAGSPDDALERIFDPFFTTKEVGEGLGLGLSISYNIVKDFDGVLRAENHPDRKSTRLNSSH